MKANKGVKIDFIGLGLEVGSGLGANVILFLKENHEHNKDLI